MKLISKTLIYYLLISLPLLLIAGSLSYILISGELRDGTDESLSKEKINAEQLIKSFKEPHNVVLSSDSLSKITIVQSYKSKNIFSDTSIYNKEEEESVKYRMLKSIYIFNNTTYQITTLKTTIEEDELMEGLLSSFALIIGFLVFSFFIVSWLLSKTLWKPFYKTLYELNNYEIKNHIKHHFESANTSEFNQLNSALNKMTEKLYSDFTQQKEFTENASHEMQTPLAVIKANLSLLMQSPNLKEEEINQLQAIDNTTKKLSSLNKALILLSKIENNQFKTNEHINLKNVIQKVLNNFNEAIEAKNIKLDLLINNDFFLNVNPTLADILFTNLLQNAIRHNKNGGYITIELRNNEFIISNSGEPLTISASDLFVRFKKNDSSKDSLGLGLSIVKSIISHYDFKISYDYQLNIHSFKISF